MRLPRQRLLCLPRQMWGLAATKLHPCRYLHTVTMFKACRGQHIHQAGHQRRRRVWLRRALIRIDACLNL